MPKPLDEGLIDRMAKAMLQVRIVSRAPGAAMWARRLAAAMYDQGVGLTALASEHDADPPKKNWLDGIVKRDAED